MYIEEKALDLTVKKVPRRDRDQGLLDLSRYGLGTKRSTGKGNKGKGQKSQKSGSKRRKSTEPEEELDMSCDDDNEDDDGDGSSSGSHGDMSRQHSREDFLHAEMLLSLKSCVGSQGDGASREGSPDLDKRSARKNNQKRKRGSKESYEGAKQSKSDEYMKNLSKIIKKVDRRVSKSGKVIVESVESEANQDNGTVLQKQWEEQLLAVSKAKEVPGTAIQTTEEEEGITELNVKASKKLKEVRGLTKAISKAKKDRAKHEDVNEELVISNAEDVYEEIKEEKSDHSGVFNEKFEHKGKKSDLQGLLDASLMSHPFKCIVCGLMYAMKDDLQAHLKTHCDYLPFKCGICGLAFEKLAFLLRNHMKNHMHNHKYVCDKCATEFSVGFQLMQHMESHENEATAIEDSADFDDSSKSAESSTAASKNNKEKKADVEKKKKYLSPFVCNLCDSSVSYGQELSNHVKRHYKEQLATEKRKNRLLKNLKKDGVDVGVETELYQAPLKQKDPVQSETRDTAKSSILAEALQSPPKYASDLVVNKAIGVIYHSSNLPAPVKDSQALAPFGTKQEEMQVENSSLTDSKVKNLVNIPKVVHVSTSSSTGSLPILIGKGENCEGAMTQSKIDQGNTGVKSQIQSTIKDTAESSKELASYETNSQAKLELSAGGLKSCLSGFALAQEAAKSQSTLDIINQSTVGITAESRDTQQASLQLAPKIDHPTAKRSSPELTQFAMTQSVQGRVVQSAPNDAAPVHSNSVVNQQKEVIIQVKQGNITQYVKVALPESLLEKTVQETSTQPVQSSLTQSTQGSLTHGAFSQAKEGTFSTVAQAPIFQFVPGGSTQPSGGSLVEQIQKADMGTATTLKIPSQEAVAQTAQGTIAKLPQSILNQTKEGLSSLLTPRAFKEEIHGDIAMPCLLQAVSVPKETTGMSWQQVSVQASQSSGTGIKSEVEEAAKSSTLQSGSPLVSQGMKNCTQETSGGNSSEILTTQLPLNSSQLKLPVLAIGSNRNQGLTSTTLVGIPPGQGLISSPVLGSNQQLTSNPLAYAIGPQLVRLDGNIGTLAQGKPHSTEQHGIPQVIQAVTAASMPVCSQILNLRGSSFPMSVNVPKENVHSQSQPVTLNVAFSDQGMKTTILWPDRKDGKLIPAASSILHGGQNVNSSVPSSHVVQKPGPVEQVDTPQFFIHSNNQEQNILNMVPSRSTVSPVTRTASQPETYFTTTVINNVTQTLTIPNAQNTSAGSPCTTYPKLEVPKLIQKPSSCLRTWGKYLQVDVERLPEWLPTLHNTVTATAGGFTQTVTISENEAPVTTIPSTISKATAQVAASAKSTGAQFSLPLIIRTSTGGGIATVQVGDKIYPLSLVFSQPLGSTQTVTSGSVSMANTVVRLPTSTVSTSTTGLSAKLPSASATTADLATNVTVSYAFPKLVSSSGSISADSTMDVDTTPKLETAVVAQPTSDAAEVTVSSTSSQPQIKSSEMAESNSSHKTASISDVSITTPVNTCTSSSPSLISLRASLTSAVCTQTTSDNLKQPSSVTPGQQEGFWLCSLCSRFFSSSSALNEHISSHRSVNDHIYKCDHCEALFYDGTQMRKHNLTHFLVVNKDPNKYKCPRCDVEFSYGYQLKCHCDWIHKNHTFPCPHCDQIFIQDVALQNHLFQHPFSCHICQSRFDNRKDVEMHVTYHEVASNTCAVCQKTCKTREDMKQHLVECRKKYSIYMCESCDVLFNSQRKFTNHIQTHYSRSVVYCGICRLAFIGIEDAQNHLSVHRKSFNCVQCDQVFQDIQQMAAHMETHENKPDNGETSANVNSKETTVEPQATKTENASDIKEELIEEGHTFSAKNKQQRSQTRRTQKDTKGLMPEDQLQGSHSLAKSKVLKEVKIKKQDVKDSDHERQQKGFICSICDVELPSRFKLKQHKVMAHYYPRTNRNISFSQHIIENIKRPKSFSCKLCNKTFDLQSTLLWHLRFHYDSNFSCRLCKIKFESKAKLIAHGKVHIFPKSVEPKRETEVSVTVKDSKESDDQTEPVGTIDNDDSDDLDQSHSEDGLQIDEESESCHSIGVLTGSGSRKVMSSVKEKLAEKCQKGRVRAAKAEALTSNQIDTSKSKKQQRKKVFGCGICKKSYFKLMKLTKHVWEHEQLQGEGQAATIATGQDESGMDTEESESKNKDISPEMRSDLEKQEAAVGISSAEKESQFDKSEGKYMCSLCKIKYHDSADLFKHAKVHLGQAEIAALARRKQKYAPVVTGDPSKPPIYTELDGSGNFVRRAPPKEDNNVDEKKGTESPDIEKGNELNKESA